MIITLAVLVAVVPRIMQKQPLMVDGQQIKVDVMMPKVTALAVHGSVEKDKVRTKCKMKN